MYQHEQHQKELCAFVDGATSINDLVEILKQIDLAAVKNLIKEQLKTTENFPSLSLLNVTKVFPIDVVQHIVSFNNFSGMKCVNKAFNKCFQKNKKNELKHRENTIIKKNIRCSTAPRKTWVVTPSKCQDDRRVVSDVIKRAKDGDRIVITDATMDKFEGSLTIDKNLEIDGGGRGVSTKVEIEDGDELEIVDDGGSAVELGWMNLDIRANVYLKNLSVCIQRLKVHAGAKLFLEQCTVTYYGGCGSPCGILVNSKASCFAFNCTLELDDLMDSKVYAFFTPEDFKNGKICSTFDSFGGYSYESGDYDYDVSPCIWMDPDSKGYQLTVDDSVFKGCIGPLVNANFETRFKLRANRKEYNPFGWLDRRICFD